LSVPALPSVPPASVAPPALLGEPLLLLPALEPALPGLPAPFGLPAEPPGGTISMSMLFWPSTSAVQATSSNNEPSNNCRG
jgi:hypothetical protein